MKEFPLPVFALGERSLQARQRLSWLPWVRYGYTKRMAPWLKARARNYDVVVINGIWNYCAAAARQSLSADIPYYVFTHGMLDPWFRKRYPLKSAFKQLSWWINEGPLLAKARAVLFTTEEERVRARNAFWPYRVKEFVVGYGTTDELGDPTNQTSRFRGRLPVLGEKPFILFLSRIHEKKGCDLLIRAFAEVASTSPNLNLVIAGPDQTGWRRHLQSLADQLGISQRVHWPGMLEGPEKWGAFRACEAFVLPSHQENFGIVVAEALACGKPVLISDKVNIWREVKESGAGLVAPDNVEGVVRLLKTFAELTPAQVKEMQFAARRLFLDCFDLNQNAAKLVQLYRNG
ncbi:glycosyltransferase involved in cell wall biosynthesis [Bradyrhizobium sp. ERR14]|nr:glycosyltransferase [Bradyrhizobium sp. ERR14]MBB4396210.1 glycosyltransferase involved in cell wall biosynthesis [Bradyrhizobium sp. ERR14]